MTARDHTCTILSPRIRLYKGDYLISLQPMPVIPFVVLVVVYSSILIDVVPGHDIHSSGLRCVVYCTAIADRDWEIVYWAADWFP